MNRIMDKETKVRASCDDIKLTPLSAGSPTDWDIPTLFVF
jgi:hypothetical protein